MSTSIKAKLFAAALLNPALVALLGGGSPTILRWYDQQLPQGAAFPAVVVRQVSNPSDYVVTGRLPTSWNRIQFTIYGTGNDSQNADSVVTALENFLDTFNATGIPGLTTYPALIVDDRDGGIAMTQPLTYQRFVDARIFDNSTI